MRKKDMVVIICTGLITMFAVTAVLGPIRSSVARENGDKAPQPVLTAGGIEFSLSLKKDSYKAGDEPVVILKAVNGNAEDKTVQAEISMMTRNVGSRLSRMVPVPSEVWSRQCTIALKGDESMTMEFETGTSVAAGNSVYFTIKVDKESLRAAHFDIPLELNKLGIKEKTTLAR